MTRAITKNSFITDGEELRRLRFAPGESPFRIKGNGYRGHLKYVQENLPGGVEAMKDAFEDPRLKEFFNQTFLASAFYDVIPLAHAGLICAEISGMSFYDFVYERTRHQAEEDVRGVYKWLLTLLSPRLVSSRLTKFMAQYFDFMSFELEHSDATVVRGRLTGAPFELRGWITAVFEAYYCHVFKLGGVKEYAIEFTERREAVGAGGEPTIEVGIELSFGPDGESA